MAKNKKVKIPTFLEIYQSQRIQVVTPKGGSHTDKTKYNRKAKHRQAWEG